VVSVVVSVMVIEWSVHTVMTLIMSYSVRSWEKLDHVRVCRTACVTTGRCLRGQPASSSTLTITVTTALTTDIGYEVLTD